MIFDVHIHHTTDPQALHAFRFNRLATRGLVSLRVTSGTGWTKLGLVPFLQCTYFRISVTDQPVAFDGLLNCSYEILLGERFRQEFDRARFHGLNGGRDIAMSC